MEQDKKSIDESFEKAFALLDQLSKDTESLKQSEAERTERLDRALSEVESVVEDLKHASKRREEESRRITDEVRGLKDLIPKAMEGQKESTDVRLKELNVEMKSLKTLMSQRLNPTSPAATSYGRGVSSTPAPTSPPASLSANGTTTNENTAGTPKPASVANGVVTESVASLQGRSPSGLGRAAIPSWQLAAANKSSTSLNTPTSGSQE